MHCVFTVRRFGLKIWEVCITVAKMRAFLSLLLYHRIVVSIFAVYPERLNNMPMSLTTPIQQSCNSAGKIHSAFAACNWLTFY